MANRDMKEGVGTVVDAAIAFFWLANLFAKVISIAIWIAIIAILFIVGFGIWWGISHVSIGIH